MEYARRHTMTHRKGGTLALIPFVLCVDFSTSFSFYGRGQEDCGGPI